LITNRQLRQCIFATSLLASDRGHNYYQCDNNQHVYVVRLLLRNNVSNKVIVETNEILGKVVDNYPPNVIYVKNGHVYYYCGLEEGLMDWYQIDKRKYKKLFKKYIRSLIWKH